jgi:hypothetical protein
MSLAPPTPLSFYSSNDVPHQTHHTAKEYPLMLMHQQMPRKGGFFLLLVKKKKTMALD